MDERLENEVNNLQHNATMKCARENEKNKAYQEGYVKGVEDLYKVIRSMRILDANKQK